MPVVVQLPTPPDIPFRALRLRFRGYRSVTKDRPGEVLVDLRIRWWFWLTVLWHMVRRTRVRWERAQS